jgi:hypothetical protein
MASILRAQVKPRALCLRFRCEESGELGLSLSRAQGQLEVDAPTSDKGERHTTSNITRPEAPQVASAARAASRLPAQVAAHSVATALCCHQRGRRIVHCRSGTSRAAAAAPASGDSHCRSLSVSYHVRKTQGCKSDSTRKTALKQETYNLSDLPVT